MYVLASQRSRSKLASRGGGWSHLHKRIGAEENGYMDVWILRWGIIRTRINQVKKEGRPKRKNSIVSMAKP